MDNIILIYYKEYQKAIDLIVKQLKQEYSIQDSNDLYWFLSIEVIRDYIKRLIWLSQSDYLSKLANHLIEIPTKTPDILISYTEWLPYQG